MTQNTKLSGTCRCIPMFVCFRIIIIMFKRRQWIKIAEDIILFSVLYLIFWCHLFCFLGVNMGWEANSLSARMLLLLRTPGRFDKILPCPHEDEQEQRLSSASIKFLWLRQIHDSSGISPTLDNALSTLLSCCSQPHFSCPCSRFLYTSSRGHAQCQRQ